MIKIDLIPQDETLANLVSGLEMVSSKMMPSTFKAFKMASNLISYTWKSYALGAPIPGTSSRIKNPAGGYAKSIKVRMLAPFNYEIYSDSHIAAFIEDGTKSYDMKRTHPFGRRSRMSKEGIPYTIIPFRHGVPGTQSYQQMPKQLYEIIRAAIKNNEIQKSRTLKGKTHSPNYKGEMIPRGKYKWGSRITGTGLENIEGMTVVDTSTKKSPRSTYMTFRIISVNSPSHKWLQAARPAKNITKHVAANSAEIVKDLISSGIKQDLGLL